MTLLISSCAVWNFATLCNPVWQCFCCSPRVLESFSKAFPVSVSSVISMFAQAVFMLQIFKSLTQTEVVIVWESWGRNFLLIHVTTQFLHFHSPKWLCGKSGGLMFGVLSCGFSLFICLISSDQGLRSSHCWTVTYNVVKIDLKLTAVFLPWLSSTEITGLQFYTQLAFLSREDLSSLQFIFFFSSCLRVLSKTSSSTLNRMEEEVGTLLSIPDLKGKAFNLSPCSVILAVVLSYRDSYIEVHSFFVFIISLGISSWINSRLWFLPWPYFIRYFWNIFL